MSSKSVQYRKPFSYYSFIITYIQERGSISITLDTMCADGQGVRAAQYLERGENEGNWVLFRISSVLAGYTFPGHHVLTSHPVKCLFSCSMTVTQPSQPQVTTFCKLVQSPQSVCDGFGGVMTSPSLTHAIQGSRIVSGGENQHLYLS